MGLNEVQNMEWNLPSKRVGRKFHELSEKNPHETLKICMGLGRYLPIRCPLLLGRDKGLKAALVTKKFFTISCFALFFVSPAAQRPSDDPSRTTRSTWLALLCVFQGRVLILEPDSGRQHGSLLQHSIDCIGGLTPWA